MAGIENLYGVDGRQVAACAQRLLPFVGIAEIQIPALGHQGFVQRGQGQRLPFRRTQAAELFRLQRVPGTRQQNFHFMQGL